jgi:hypothetical protein
LGTKNREFAPLDLAKIHDHDAREQALKKNTSVELGTVGVPLVVVYCRMEQISRLNLACPCPVLPENWTLKIEKNLEAICRA